MALEKAYRRRWVPAIAGFVLCCVSRVILAVVSMPYQDMTEELYQQSVRPVRVATAFFVVCLCVLLFGIVYFIAVTRKYKGAPNFLSDQAYTKRMVIPIAVCIAGYGFGFLASSDGIPALIQLLLLPVWTVYVLANTHRHAKRDGRIAWKIAVPCTLAVAGLSLAREWLAMRLSTAYAIRGFTNGVKSLFLASVKYGILLPLVVVALGLLAMQAAFCLKARAGKRK